MERFHGLSHSIWDCKYHVVLVCLVWFWYGVGPCQVFVKKRRIVNYVPKNGPILSFSRAKRAFFSENYSKSKAAFHSG
jgi:hypothetical protein